MDDLLAAVARLWTASAVGEGARLIGGLAVRLHVGGDARLTRDVGIVVLDRPTRERIFAELDACGYEIGTTGHWWRAVPQDPAKPIVDVTSDPVVDPNTFDAVHLAAAPVRCAIGDTVVVVAGVDDIAVLKLLAARDQDLVDLLLLASRRRISPAQIALAAAQDDVERRVAAGALQARHALCRGIVSDVALEALGRPAGADEVAALQELLGGLEKAGL